jgi:hypothetical protein
MNTEIDYNLTPDQWEALKAVRLTESPSTISNRIALEELIALRLAAIVNNGPALTPRGRKVLIRGSSRLWDVAA